MRRVLGQHMFTGVPNEPVRRRAVIAFKNIANVIPEDAVITSAKLHLHLSRETSDVIKIIGVDGTICEDPVSQGM